MGIGLVKDLVTFVYERDVLRGPDITIRIGRGAVTDDARERDAVKVKTGDYIDQQTLPQCSFGPPCQVCFHCHE